MAVHTRTADETRTTPRRYQSPRREQQARNTRDALIAAATELFTTRGWTATGMRDIAVEAGVATETIYKHFASKAELLRRAADVAVVGDDAPVPLADRREFAAMGVGSRHERVAAAARVVVGVNERTAGFARALREAAPTDETIAEALRAAKERQRADVAAGATLVLGRRPTETERDGLWALVSIEVYLLLVEGSGWSIEQYETWLATMLDAAIPSG